MDTITDGWPEELRETMVELGDLPAETHARQVQARRVPLHEFDEEEFVVLVRIRVFGYQPATEGRFNGPPEDCYPPEPADIDADARTADGTVLALDADVKAEVLERYEAWLCER